MASQSTPKNLDIIREHLTSTNLQAIRSFWFEHLDNPDDFILAEQEKQKRWFMSGEEFDNVCVSRFRPILEAVRSTGITSAQDIITIIQPQTPMDWLSLVLLLDQIPRNCYRGAEASICFRFFDPLAQQVAKAAFEKGIPDQEPSTRWQFSYRSWFYMPLMHSETLSSHEIAVTKYENLARDINSLFDANTPGDEYEKRAKEVVQREPEMAKMVATMGLEFEKKHMVLIQRFGRYPHRNKAMGREPTAEETEFLENGGDTFGS